MSAGTPTGIHLPGLLFNPKTRVAGEFYLYYNLARARYVGAIGIDAEGDEAWRAEQSCGELPNLPASNIGVVRAKVPLNNTAPSTWSIGAGTGTLPTLAPPGQAAEIGTIVIPVGNPAMTTVNTQPGDSVDVIALPGQAGDVLICYDQGFTANPGDEYRAIARKFVPVDHYVRQRPENSIDLSEFYVSSTIGLERLRGRTVTLKGVFYPDGGSVPSEIIYFTDVRLNVPFDIPDDSNDSVNPGLTGTFRDLIALTGQPA